ncbi:hypothetical protein E2C01_029777 [Portunus trituberculatus]|uniref:Uncharacterized protein n=1 Tax=Portunus trituberculatus TaxID=210409 RepID=A0A5B7EQ83_PORTR|nr:hypothetical protein [Portunus trituberculatus]
MKGVGGSRGGWLAYPCCDVSVCSWPDTAELHNDGNEIEQSGNGGIEQLLKEKCVLRSGNRVCGSKGNGWGGQSSWEVWPSYHSFKF